MVDGEVTLVLSEEEAEAVMYLLGPTSPGDMDQIYYNVFTTLKLALGKTKSYNPSRRAFGPDYTAPCRVPDV